MAGHIVQGTYAFLQCQQALVDLGTLQPCLPGCMHTQSKLDACIAHTLRSICSCRMMHQSWLCCSSYLSLSYVSAPRSLPARSMKEILPTDELSSLPLPSGLFRFRTNCMMEWLREESALAPVDPVLLAALLCSMSCCIVVTCHSHNTQHAVSPRQSVNACSACNKDNLRSDLCITLLYIR